MARQRMPAWPSVKAKVVVVGDTGVGKTSIILRYDGRGFTSTVSATIGANYIVSNQLIESKRVELQIWDTAGQERFRAMVPMYLRNAAAAFIVFDITSRTSFDHLPGWVEDIQRSSEHVQLFLLANKIDLDADRSVSRREAEAFAEQVGATSAFHNRGIEKVIHDCAQRLLQQSEARRSSSIYSHESPTSQLNTEEAKKSSCSC